MSTRLGLRERQAIRQLREERSAKVAANLANLDAIREEQRLLSLRSSANTTRLREATHMGYADNLHSKRVGSGPNAGSCRVDKDAG